MAEATAKEIGQVVHLPSWAPAPAFMLRLILGEMEYHVFETAESVQVSLGELRDVAEEATEQGVKMFAIHTKTGANRLKGGMAPGWALNHKTGTGQVLGSQQAGYNDIGILTAPDGKSYAVAVMIKLTSVPLPVRMEFDTEFGSVQGYLGELRGAGLNLRFID